jgi:hypothetical protein
LASSGTGVNASGFQQLGIFAADALDAHKVCVVDPFQDQFLGNARLLSELGAMLLGCALLEERFQDTMPASFSLFS